ncbi:hypothetical protein [Silvanigrella aquatica]|uniref:Uncharacterized protein n=1 Tax=Silvanigrella aquatica TaxID=1915309 RepID=A0A1L4D1P1_9BACT|nr:hypothetical protein [Silvanigrella aquatica]APJ04111.1 hypothetical protein AXG55_09405 [Silvanigrella aquatica]
MKLNFFLKFFLFLILIFNKNIFADEAYVFCSDKDRNWEWLKINDEYIKVSGFWLEEHLNENFSIFIFKLENSESEIQNLQKKCINNFGEQFIYPQPSITFSHKWGVFYLESEKKIIGNFSLSLYYFPFTRSRY